MAILIKAVSRGLVGVISVWLDAGVDIDMKGEVIAASYFANAELNQLASV